VHVSLSDMACDSWKINLSDGGSRILVGFKLTFINAFESSTVHCLNPRPSGYRRSPGNEGAAAFLQRCQCIQSL